MLFGRGGNEIHSLIKVNLRDIPSRNKDEKTFYRLGTWAKASQTKMPNSKDQREEKKVVGALMWTTKSTSNDLLAIWVVWGYGSKNVIF